MPFSAVEIADGVWPGSGRGSVIARLMEVASPAQGGVPRRRLVRKPLHGTLVTSTW